VSLFFIGAACAGTSPFSIFFFYFSETKPVWALEARRSLRLGASERARRSGSRSTPDSLRAGALARRSFPFFLNRAQMEVGRPVTLAGRRSAPRRAGRSGSLDPRRSPRWGEGERSIFFSATDRICPIAWKLARSSRWIRRK
jgi:hypothetical protein